MGAGFNRYYTTDQPDSVLLQIEGVVVEDLPPQAPIAGVGTGVVCVIGEAEDGPFNTPYEISGATDYQNTFGRFGYVYSGTLANNPCARKRFADFAVNPEPWNGNLAVNVSGKTYASLVVVRVNTSVGTVQFTRLANLVGVAQVTYLLTTGESITFNDGSGSHSATFAGVAATVTGTSGVFTTTNAGDTVVLGYDGNTFTTTFLSTDVTEAAIIARINQYAGFTFATDSSGQIKLTGRQAGTGGSVSVVSYTGTQGLAGLGLTAAVTAGTGTVANIAAVTPAELNTRVNAANAEVIVEVLPNGQPRMVALTGATLVITAMTATAFGFPVNVTDAAASGNAGTIPAGTVVQTSGGMKWVTMQTLTVAANNAGPYATPIRPALDDGTGVSAIAGAVDIITTPIQLDAFSVINLLPVSAALSEGAIDSAYLAAIASTLAPDSISSVANIFYSARQSNAVRAGLKANVILATQQGLTPRVCCVRPPLGTTTAQAESATVAPGVGVTAHERVFYEYPGWSTTISDMAAVGTAGGYGFTANGVIDVGSDGFLAALMSLLPPEQNPGQLTPYLGAVVGLESALQGVLTLQDYENFKANGICAPRMDAQGNAFYQSGCTSVNPLLYPGLVTIARRRMGDFVQSSLSAIAQPFVKTLATTKNRNALISELRNFLSGLSGLTNQNEQRIAGFTVRDESTPQEKAMGLQRIRTDARTLSSLDSIVLMSTVGESVQVDELGPGQTQ
jgi:hypothetical protein